MAKPRVFISSTYYDLKHARDDIATFLREIGYEPVRSERGDVPYGSEEKLEEYCYKEIGFCDIVIAIVGGRFGSSSQHPPHSVSQMEIKTALELGKPVYIFVDKAIWYAFPIYKENKDKENIHYPSVDNIEVFRFLESLEALPCNNPIKEFETSGEIVSYLREQWAGLFQRLLQEQSRLKEVRILEGMQSTARTLDELVTYLRESRQEGDQAIREILMGNHPAFLQLQELMGVPYRVYFTKRDEFAAWLGARNYKKVDPAPWDDEGIEEWNMSYKNKLYILKISLDIFDDDGNLKIFTSRDWDNSKITHESGDVPPDEPPADRDDIPF